MARHGARQVAIIAFGVVAAVSAPGAQEPQPTFRSEIDFVQIPVRVLDARGDFVYGLTQSDFHILEDGQPQAITTFSAVDIPFIRAGGATPEAPVAGEEAVASNDALQVDGRVYVFVLDNQSMAAAVALRTRHVMRRFLRDSFAANDMAAIVLTGTGRGQSFTRNPRLLDEAIERLMSDADPTDNSADRVMQRIADTARWMGAIKGRRKALVLITPSSICSLANTNLAVFSNCNEAARYALRMAVQSDVSIYTIDPRGAVPTHGAPAEFSGSPGRPVAIVRGPFDAARYLAEESGGFAVVNSNSLDAGFARVMRENSSYYLLGYYSTNAQADGKFRRNQIRVSRPRLQVVYRSGYLAPAAKADLKVSTTTGSTTTSLEARMQELANNPLPVSALPLRIAAAPFASADGESIVAVTVEIPGDTLAHSDRAASVRRVRLSVGFYDRNGVSVGGADPTIDIPSEAGEPLRFASKIPVPAGEYRLWVGGVETSTGLSGSVITEIDVPDFTRPRLALSGITLSRDTTQLAHREFSTDTELSLSGEIYDRRVRRGPVSATVTVKSRDGKIMYETPFQADSAGVAHRARIPLKQLGAGSYVATVEAVSTAPRRASAVRRVTFTVK